MNYSFAGLYLDSNIGIAVQYSDKTEKCSEFGLEIFYLLPVYFCVGGFGLGFSLLVFVLSGGSCPDNSAFLFYCESFTHLLAVACLRATAIRENESAPYTFHSRLRCPSTVLFERSCT